MHLRSSPSPFYGEGDGGEVKGRDKLEKILVKECEVDQLNTRLKEILDEGENLGWLDNLKSKVVIKPNLCDLSAWDLGATTDPEIVLLIVKYLKKKKPDLKFYVIESDARERATEEAFHRLGYYETLKDEAELINITHLPQISVEVPTYPYELFLPEFFFDDFFFISVANLKTHTYQKISCAVKNQFGCVPERDRRKYHPYLEEVLDFINRAVKPDLCLVDGRVGMEGAGPVGGTPVETKILILGKDPFSTDVACAQIMGMNPKKIPFLRYMAKRNDLRIEPALNGYPNFKFKLIPFYLYHFMRAKIRVTRLSDRLEKNMKNGINSFYNLGRVIIRKYLKFIFPPKAI
jgi:uncharacterized protein (DUF362 family)